ncbi:MAG: low molecular weight protein-tyrosine-phosphatase [Elainellaceae cyanobacterium]
MTYKLLFVCLGNICRSPSAEGIMNHLIQQYRLQHEIVCDSSGTSDYHIGKPPDERMTLAAHQQGIQLTGHARQFHPRDFEAFDLILAMDRDNYADILSLDFTGQYRHKVKLMCDFCRHYPDKEVPDPYYGGPDGFTYVIDLLLDACNGLIDHVKSVQGIR